MKGPWRWKLAFISLSVIALTFRNFKVNIGVSVGRQRSTSISNVAVYRSHDDVLDVDAFDNRLSPNQDNLQVQHRLSSSKDFKFYMLPTPEVTEWLLGNYSQEALEYYDRALNEDQAELWLYRSLLQHPQRTFDATKANVIAVCGLLHFQHYLTKTRMRGTGHSKRPSKSKKPRQTTSSSSNNGTDANYGLDLKAYATTVANRVMDLHLNTENPPSLLMAIPTTNPATSRYIGVRALVKALTSITIDQDSVWSWGFERNTYWQGLPPHRIVPIPYVVKLAEEEQPPQPTDKNQTFQNQVFYAGDARPHAVEWSGCDRSMVAPLQREPSMFVRLFDKKHHHQRLSQSEYLSHMRQSEFCLILCGDSPTSRSLASAMVHQCVPVFVGSRWRGLCEPPCHKGWGWTIAGSEYPHLPFLLSSLSATAGTRTQIDNNFSWHSFPEVNELEFQQSPATVLQQALASISNPQKAHLRSILKYHREAFIYGWGNPVNSIKLGQATNYAWESFVHTLQQEASKKDQTAAA